MSSPRVGWSVAMCTYNGERFLQRQLDSISAQVLRPDELVVVDDASSDATTEIVRGFAVDAPFRVELIERSSNVGSTLSFQAALSRTTGDLVSLCDQDDLWHPDRLSGFQQVFDDRPDAGLLFSDALMIDDADDVLGFRAWDTEQVDFSPAARAAFVGDGAFERLVNRPVVTGAGCAFRGRYRDLVLPFPEEVVTAAATGYLIHDGWIALAIAAVAEVVPIAEPLWSYRQHVDQQLGLRLVLDVPPPSLTLRELLQLRRRDLRPVAGRLDEVRRLDGPRTQAIRDRLADELSYLEARLDLPAGRLRRVPTIVGLGVSGRYSRWGRGWHSALRDVVRAV